MLSLGVDYHKKFSQVAVMDERGEPLFNQRLPNEKIVFERLLGQLDQPCQGVVEASRTWGVMYDILEDLGVDMKLAHPTKVKAKALAKIKNDKVDASTLAHLLRADLIPEVYVPSKKIRHQKNILRQRVWLVKLRTMTKNRIHQIIDRNHIQTPGFKDMFGSGGRKFLGSLELPYPDNGLLKDHLEILDFIGEYLGHTEKMIAKEVKDDRQVEIIGSLPGFGKYFSPLVALEVADINRFSTPAKLTAYCGLSPSMYSSADKTYYGRLIPGCNRWLRFAFIEGAWVSLRTSPYCRAYFDRMMRRRGKNVAITALARKLCEFAYYCLKEDRYYQERPYSYYRKPQKTLVALLSG
jgi:transposase